MKTLSEQLADLSARAAKVEARADAFKQESHEKRDAKVAEIKAAVESAQNRFETSVKDKNDEIKSAWAEFNANMKARTEKVKAKIEGKKEAIDKGRAEHRADRLENNADVAIGFAILTIEDAEYAVLEALDARLHAESFD
jgi:hypothetical protein